MQRYKVFLRNLAKTVEIFGGLDSFAYFCAKV